MRRERGVTIVEGLVALVILSVGMLGIASLYVTSLKTGRTALLRTHAVNLVNDIIDSIRANSRAGAAYALENLAAAPTEDVPSEDDPPEEAPPPICGDDGVCTADQIADQDLMNWAAAVRAALPGADASITYTNNPGTTPDVYTVSVSWRESADTPSGDTPEYNYQGSLEILPVMP